MFRRLHCYKMRKIILFFLFFFARVSTVEAQHVNVCNQEARLLRMQKMVPKSFCMPRDNWIRQMIDTVDLNGDLKDDKVLLWGKKKFEDGDTLNATIFFKRDSVSYVEYGMLPNLYTPLFKDYTGSISTGNLALDSVYVRFIYSNLTLVRYKSTEVIVGFFTDAGGGLDLHFRFDASANDFYLRKKVSWDYLNKVEGMVVTGEIQVFEGISIRNLKILDFIN